MVDKLSVRHQNNEALEQTARRAAYSTGTKRARMLGLTSPGRSSAVTLDEYEGFGARIALDSGNRFD